MLLRELDGITNGDRYFLSPRIQTLKAIRAKICPEPVWEPLPPLRGICAIEDRHGEMPVRVNPWTTGTIYAD